jgi:hypothetical protein
MRFCPWYPLAECDRHAPTTGGVFQVRIEDGLVDYPSGKSAMIHYQVAEDLRAAITAFRTAHPGESWLCRHTVEMTDHDVAARGTYHDRLLRDFTARFGIAPRLP